MIKISLDEAYVFDMLSILCVKMKKLNGDKFEITRYKYETLTNEIQEQIGVFLFEKIISSKEFLEMIDANEKIFNLIDQDKTKDSLAQITDDANHIRFLKKLALQDKFFDQKLTEMKNRD